MKNEEWTPFIGERVFWTDPDDGLCSDYCTVNDTEGYNGEEIFFLQKDDGGEVMALLKEIKPLKKRFI